ncbi:MAG: carbohydrate ABC transporter permease [Clostridia bacterium]|nr:carbohydrate ABC transporter permease [Clostridia bacterium]
MKNKTNFKKSLSSRFSAIWEKWKSLGLAAQIFLTAFFCFFLFEAIVQVYPFLWVINNSLKTFDELNNDSVALTQAWEFINYVRVFSEFKVLGNVYYFEMLWNSVWQTFVFLFVNIAASVLVAYALAKFKFPGRALLYGIMIFTQTIPILGTGGASYKLRFELGMINNPWTIWLGWAVGFDYSAFIFYGAFQSVSNSYAESAELDGANELQIFAKIILPQVFPAILALMVTNFVGRWNDYSTAQIYLSQFPTLGYGLFLYGTGANWSEYGKTVYYAALIITALPGVLLYACFQGLIIKNVSVGGLKG